MLSDDIAISVRNLTKTYRLFGHPGDRIKQFFSLGLKQYHREFTALKDASFDIKKGETVGIIGRNGSGKSTLLQLICGILKPTSGTVQVNGRVSALLELGAGFNPEFTGRENIYFQGALMGFTTAQMDARFDEIAAFADIGEFIEQPVRTYSSGMFVRLAFAVAINVDPEILVVDEALAVGDIAFQAKSMSAFHQLREAKVTVILVSHDPNAIKALCDQAIWLDHGSTRLIGKTGEVVDGYRRELMGPPSADFLSASELNAAPPASITAEASNLTFRNNPEFGSRVAAFRRGTGEASITDVELLDINRRGITQAKFGQPAFIRLHVLFRQALDVAVSYYIRDDKHHILMGSTTLLEGYGLVAGTTGAKKILEFQTCLPLAEGAYNLLAILSVPVVPNQSAQFIDYIENALVFSVAARAPVKLWSKFYLANTLKIHDV